MLLLGVKQRAVYNPQLEGCDRHFLVSLEHVTAFFCTAKLKSEQKMTKKGRVWVRCRLFANSTASRDVRNKYLPYKENCPDNFLGRGKEQ